MICKSEMMSQASGTIGGTTYSHGVSGLQRQAAQNRSNTATNRQLAVRSVFASLAYAWKSVLTDTQRLAWHNYARLTPTTGRFGDSLVLSGSNMFTRCNAIRLQAGLTRVDDGPTQPGLVSLNYIGGTSNSAAGLIILSFAITDAWATDLAGGLNLQTSLYLQTSKKNIFTEQMRYHGTLPGELIPNGFWVRSSNAWNQGPNVHPNGQKLAYRVVAFLGDGRISSPLLIPLINQPF